MKRRVILELGQYVAPAYAGMILAEQGWTVVKWANRADPILGLVHGEKLWRWLNAGKTVVWDRHPRDVTTYWPDDVVGVFDNIRPSKWSEWHIDPAKMSVPWVTLMADVGDRSFDAVAQARAWGNWVPPIPFYIGDTAAGLWMAFKLLNVMPSPGWYKLGQATVLAKLVEMELARPEGPSPWDAPGTYEWDGCEATIIYRGQRIVEPARDAEWRWKHLWHDADGRLRV